MKDNDKSNYCVEGKIKNYNSLANAFNIIILWCRKVLQFKTKIY